MEDECCSIITKRGKQCKNKVSKDGMCKLHSLMHKCPICLESSMNMFTLSCGHRMHTSCLENLVKLECPMCRKEPTNLDDELKEKILKNVEDRKEELDQQDRQEILDQLEQAEVHIPIVIEIDAARRFLQDQGVPSELFPEVDLENSDTEVPRGYVFQQIVAECLHLIQCMTEELELNPAEEEVGSDSSS